MIRLRNVLLLLTLVVAAIDERAFAQEDPAQVVQAQAAEAGKLAATWLDSDDARIRAWGAYVALHDQQRQLVPRVVALIEAHPVKTGALVGADREAHDAMLSALDALIQMDGFPRRVSPNVAAALYPEFPAQSLILLSRTGSPADTLMADGLLLDIFRQERTAIGAWLAAGNLLADHRASGFAAALLRDVAIDLQVRVVDQGSVAPRGQGVGGSCAWGMAGPITSGWPEVGNYYISRRGTLLAGLGRGRDPSFYIREVSGPDPHAPRADFPCDDVSQAWNRDSLAERFLAGLAGESPDAPSVRLHVAETITWRSDAQYVRDLEALVGRQQRLLDALGATLIGARRLSSDEWAAVRPSRGLRIADERGRKPSPLPALRLPVP